MWRVRVWCAAGHAIMCVTAAIDAAVDASPLHFVAVVAAASAEHFGLEGSSVGK